MASSVAAPEAPNTHVAAPASRRLADQWPLAVLALAMGAAALLLLYLTRGFTFYYDEWNFLINRQEFTADALLRPHNEHNVMIAVLLFKGLWELVGLDHYIAFRLLVVALHLLCGGLLYVYARRRVGPVLALAPALILLFLGTAWEIILWPFEVQFLIPIAAGLGAFMLLERRELRSDLWASALLVLALAGGSLGIPMLVGAGVDIVFRQDRRQTAGARGGAAGRALRGLAARVRPVPRALRHLRVGARLRVRAARVGARGHRRLPVPLGANAGARGGRRASRWCWPSASCAAGSTADAWRRS